MATLLTLVAFRHMRELAEAQKTSLRNALDQADRRNRELERLRHLAGTLLAGVDLESLVKEVARSRGDLLEAESGAVTLVVEEGRFLRVVAACGPLEPPIGMLLPMDESLARLGGRARMRRSCRTTWTPTRAATDPAVRRCTLKTAAIVPLRSAGVAIGTVSVYNRRDGQPFSDHDLRLLQILGDQVVVGPRPRLGAGGKPAQRAGAPRPRTWSCSGPPSSRASSSPTCRTSCAPRSTPSSGSPT